MARQPKQTSDEREFLAKYKAEDFDRPSVTVDIVLLTVREGKLMVLARQRDDFPEVGSWCLPGGFIQLHESLDESAQRVLAEKTDLKPTYLEQLYTFGRPDRDPRMRILTVAHYALIAAKQTELPDDSQCQWKEVVVSWKGEKGGAASIHDDDQTECPLAFDHAEIIGYAVLRLRGKLNYAPIGFELLPKHFTLRQLQEIHETILGRRLNKDSFRRKVISSGLVTPLGKRESDVGHRPAELYRFSRKPMR